MSQDFTILVFGKTLAVAKEVDAYGPMLRFHNFAQPWYLHEDRQFYYDVLTNGGRFLSDYDWIGLFKENFTSLDEYHGYAWASTSKRTDEVKKVWMSDTVVNLAGRYVLVYISSKSSILGMSEAFDLVAQ